jgi:hypothetical protein
MVSIDRFAALREPGLGSRSGSFIVEKAEEKMTKNETSYYNTARYIPSSSYHFFAVTVCDSGA